MNIEDTISLIRIWGLEKGITGPNGKATAFSQFNKLTEEVNELRAGIQRNDVDEIQDAIGDCVVVLTLLAERSGLKIEDCILSAYNEIKGRTGQMIGGTFVKDQPSTKGK